MFVDRRSLRPSLICLLLFTGLAACAGPPQASNRAPLPAQYTLAIFPWLMTDHMEHESYIYSVDALKRELAKSTFIPRYSYYPFRKTTRITSSNVPGIEEFWAGGSFQTGPPRDHVVALGKPLAVDAVLAYAINARAGPDEMWVHLFDLPTNTHYGADGWVPNYHEDVVEELSRMTRQVFAEFLSRRQKAKTKSYGTQK